MTEETRHFDPEAFRAGRSTPANAAKPAKADLFESPDSQLSQVSQAQEHELAIMTEELAEERTWLAEQGLLLPGDGDATEFRGHLTSVRVEHGLPAALAEARRHWTAAVECKVLSLSNPQAKPRAPRPFKVKGHA